MLPREISRLEEGAALEAGPASPAQLGLMVAEMASRAYSMPCAMDTQCMGHSLQTAHSLDTSLHSAHRCTRFCVFEHVCGNVWTCRTSGATHICDSTCDQRIQLDSHQAVCRLSKRVFAIHQQRSDVPR